MRLQREKSFLLVVDVQQKLAPHVEGHERVISKSSSLVQSARKLGIPVFLSEHCSGQIGSTVPSLAQLVVPTAIVGKTHFACTDEKAILAKFKDLKRDQVVVAGMEAHVCVLQTTLGLLESGFQPFLVRDAVGSRREEDRATALERMRAAGASVTTTEATLFEWMQRADIPEFRDLLRIIKSA